MKAKFLLAPAASLIVFGGPAYANVYLTVEQAQSLMFPHAILTPAFQTLTGEQVKAIEKMSGVPVRAKQLKAWKVSTGGWFLADEAVGKHEFIPFALALDDKGAVKSIEILEYREAYGSQIRDRQWRGQFTGKQAGAKLQLGKEIQNISGATLSCRHITDAVKRLLSTHAVVLNHAAS